MAAIRKYWDEENTYKHQLNLKINFKKYCSEDCLLNEIQITDTLCVNR